MKKLLGGLLAAISVIFATCAAQAQAIDPVARGMAAQALNELSGALPTNCATLTTALPCFQVTGTWNASGVTFPGAVKVNMTNTASASGSLLLDLQASGSSKFSVDKGGTTATSGPLGIGAAPITGTKLYLSGSITGATTAFSTRAVTTIASDVSTLGVIFSSAPSTQAASFTLPTLQHFRADNVSVGAGSAITTQIGFIAAGLTGGVNNFGFYSDIASGSNRWNFYDNGTANNAFAGNSRFGGTTAPVATVDVTGSLATTSTIAAGGNLSVTKSGSGTDVSSTITNSATGASTNASYNLATGTASSTAQISLQDNTAAPFVLGSLGTAVSGWSWNGTQHQWRDASGTAWETINSSGIRAELGKVLLGTAYTSSFPMLTRNATNVEFRLGDNSARAPVQVNYVQMSSGTVFGDTGTDGVGKIHNAAGTSSSLVLGPGATTSWPRLKASGNILQIRLGDDSAYTSIRASGILFGSGSLINDNGDGIISMFNSATTGFTRLTMGPNTASFPAIGPNGTTLEVKLGDGSAFAPVSASKVLGNGGSATLAALFPNISETATVSATAATGTINYDITTQSIVYYTSNASANWTVNLRGSSGTTLNTVLSTGQAVTAAFAVTQGSPAFYNTAVQVDGTATGVTTKWQGGAPVAGTASSIDVYTYTVIKTGSATFTVLATKTAFQ